MHRILFSNRKIRRAVTRSGRRHHRVAERLYDLYAAKNMAEYKKKHEAATPAAKAIEDQYWCMEIGAIDRRLLSYAIG